MGVFHSTRCFQGSRTLLQVSECPSVLGLITFPGVCITPVNHSFVDGHLVAATLWLLWTTLLWTWVCKSLSEYLLSNLLNVCLELDFLDHTEFYFSVFEELLYCCPQGLHRFTFLPAVLSVPVSPHPCQHLLLFCFDGSHRDGFKVAPLRFGHAPPKWPVMSVSLCADWPLVCCLQRNV